MAGLWGEMGSRSADVAIPGLQQVCPLPLESCAWSAEGHPCSPYLQRVAFRVSFQCIPHVFAFCRL